MVMSRWKAAGFALLAVLIAATPLLHAHPLGKPGDSCGTCASGPAHFAPARAAAIVPAPVIGTIAADPAAGVSPILPRLLASRAPPSL